jgi:hypothetical protein
MTKDLSTQPHPPASPRKTKSPVRFFSIGILSRFMRVTYGADALQEVERRVSTYMAATNFEVAGIWMRVLRHLRGVYVNEDARRVVKAKRTLKVKT